MQGLSRTLFERLQGMYAESISEVLTVQYRMHAAIMEWSSQELYQGKLTAHASVASHTLSDMQVRQLPSSIKVLQNCVTLSYGTPSASTLNPKPPYRQGLKVRSNSLLVQRHSIATGSGFEHGPEMGLQGVDAGSEALGPLLLIDTAGCDLDETADEDSDSKRNEGEAKVR